MSTLPDEIARYSLTRCYYLSLSCFECGELRAAVSEIPTSRFFTCPQCQGEANYRIIGEGGTVKPLPFSEKLVADEYRAFYRQLNRD